MYCCVVLCCVVVLCCNVLCAKNCCLLHFCAAVVTVFVVVVKLLLCVVLRYCALFMFKLPGPRPRPSAKMQNTLGTLHLYEGPLPKNAKSAKYFRYFAFV